MILAQPIKDESYIYQSGSFNLYYSFCAFYFNILESSFGADLVFHHTVTREQRGTYTCTAHNALGTAKANATLNVFYPPVCRVRKETGIRDGLKLRCDVISGFPTTDISFTWYHNNRILSSESGSSLYISKDLYG